MAAHQFTLTGTQELQAARQRTQRRKKYDSLAARLTQDTLENALAKEPDPILREKVFEKVRGSLLFIPHEDTLLRAFVKYAKQDEETFVDAVLSVAPDQRCKVIDLVWPLCTWTPSAAAQQFLSDNLPSAIVSPDGTPADVAPQITLTDLP
jgi:hypothetical protein